MASSSRAPKQWSLTRSETINSFENWRQNLLYVLCLDNNFARFLKSDATWNKKSKASPMRGLVDDAATVETSSRKTKEQKHTALELMLGQIANYCPVISRNTIVKNSTCLNDIWQSIRLHYGFQSNGAFILDFAEYKLEPNENPEDLYQRLMAFIEDNLLQANSCISHHGEAVTDDEELSPTMENVIVLTWLRLVHPGLPKLVKQRYGTELRSKTLSSIKPEISVALSSLLEELHTGEEIQTMRGSVRGGRSHYRGSTRSDRVDRNKTCSLCVSSGKPSNHYLSQCTFLSESDRSFLARARTIDATPLTDNEGSPVPNARRIQVEQSPYISLFHRHTPVRVTLDTGATGNMIRYSTARQLGVKISKTKQSASQADGSSQLEVMGETDLVLTRDDRCYKFDGLVVRELDVDILGGVPFMSKNDILTRPAKLLVTVDGCLNYTYDPNSKDTQAHAIRRAQATLLRASERCTIWPGEFLELTVPEEYLDDEQVILEPRLDTRLNSGLNLSEVWPQPTILGCVGRTIRVPNTAAYPLVVGKGEHLVQIQSLQQINSLKPPVIDDIGGDLAHERICNSFRSVVMSNTTLSTPVATKFTKLHETMRSVFEANTSGYNGDSGPITAVVNVGPVQPPQRKGRVPQYSRNRLEELQEKFDELEKAGVFRRPEDIGVVVEYLNPSFLVKKPKGGFRLVTAFNEVGKYCKPQPSLMPDVNSILRSIGQWKYIISTDLSAAFYQIHLDTASMKYCGVATPFRGIRVYTRCAMGMPGSETALEELMCRVLGDMLVKGSVVKLADDLYCGGNTEEELYNNWKTLLECLAQNNISIAASKTVIAPKTTTILGWKWSSGGILEACPHKVAPLSTCALPRTVKELRSFVGAYKVLSRVIPQCSRYLAPLDELVAGRESLDKLIWTDDSQSAFASAQKALSLRTTIVLPQTSDKLWIVTDGANVSGGLGAALYVERSGQQKAAGFFSAKIRKPQSNWLPCETEALSIAAAVKHFSPFIVQSDHQAVVLTDSKPCVQAYDKLGRGEFSASPRVTTFLTTISRYLIAVRHIAGAANLVSDFSSRNAPLCDDPLCQICKFVSSLNESVVRTIDAHEVLSRTSPAPFVTRSAWKLSQDECPDLRRVRAHLLQGTRPSKKVTNVHDIKRYLNCVTLAKDGVLVVLSSRPMIADRERIVIPQRVLGGLLTALHLKLNHPSCHQLKELSNRYFFALNLGAAAQRVSDSCHQCTSLRTIKHVIVPQTTESSPGGVGSHFAADVLKRSKQLVLVVREHVTAYTVACIILDERKVTLRDGIVQLLADLRPVDGPAVVVRTDPAPGFVSLVHDALLAHQHIQLEIGSAKNCNKNPVAEKAIQELVRESLSRDPTGSAFTPSTLSVALSSLNSRIRSSGLSASEMWTQRDQFTGEQIPLSDVTLVSNIIDRRHANHEPSTLSKCPKLNTLPANEIRIGDLVYLNSEGSKLRARDRYLVVDIEGHHYVLRKFTSMQFRAQTYRVKKSDCFKAASIAPEYQVTAQNDSSSSEEDERDSQERDSSLEEVDNLLGDDLPGDEPEVTSLRRSSRVRRPPAYLRDYVSE